MHQERLSVGDIIKQIDSYKTKSEGGIDMPILRIKLCGEDCKIVYKEKPTGAAFIKDFIIIFRKIY